MSFSFAKVWAAEKDTLEDVADEDQGDSWAQTLQKITAEREKVQAQEIALSGRGVRRRAAAIAKVFKFFASSSSSNKVWQKNYVDNSPVKDSDGKKGKGKGKPKVAYSEDGSAYSGSVVESDGEDSDTSSALPTAMDLDLDLETGTKRASHSKFGPNTPLSPIQNYAAIEICGLCGRRHDDRPGECLMTEKSENLAEFREMLILHADDEPLELRVDFTLYRSLFC